MPDYIQADLCKRNLPDALIEEMQLTPMTPDSDAHFLPCYPKCDHGFYIPYQNVEPQQGKQYARRRNLGNLPFDEKGNPVKYSSPLHQNHLYLLPCDSRKLASPKSHNLYVEGEIKAAVLSRVARDLDTADTKYAVIGIGGVWNGDTATEFAALPATDRQHVLFFDADALTNPNVAKAAYRLTAALMAKGASYANIRCASWNPTLGKGIDDVLLASDATAGTELLRDLLRQALPVLRAYPLGIDSACRYLGNPNLAEHQVSQIAAALLAAHKPDGVTKTEIKRLLRQKMTRNAEKAAAKVREQAGAAHVTPPVVFWKETADGVTIDRKRFLAWLAAQGFGILCKSERLLFVRIVDKIMTENRLEHGENIDIKRFTIAYLQRFALDAVENCMLSGHVHYFAPAALTTLPFLTPTFCQDTKSTAYLFFRNGFVVITQTSATLKSYVDLPGVVWEKQILPYDYSGVYTTPATARREPQGDFLRFFEAITAQPLDMTQPISPTNWIRDSEKQAAFVAAYGYLLHGWKNPTTAKAVICNDNTLGKIGADGRTGKSLFARSLKYLKNVTIEAGKTWQPEDRFAFQNVSLDTQIIFIDDISRKFKLEMLYPATTGEMSCEGKGLKKMVIPFEQSAKIIVTGNIPVLNEGDSDEARQWVLPFSRLFSLTYTPEDFFGHQLFTDWQDGDWQDFFDFAIFAIGFYLHHGFTVYVDPEFERARLTYAMPEEVLDFFDGLTLNANHSKEAALSALKDQVDGLTAKMFSKYARIYARAKKYVYSEHRRAGTRADGQRDTNLMWIQFSV